MKTKWHQKLLASIINALIVFIVIIPIWLFEISSGWQKLIIIMVFFFYELAFMLLAKDGRDLGMRVVGSRWRKNYSNRRKVVYTIFYTASFASIFFWVRYPFDLLLMNLLLIQLPSVLLSGTTFHGWIAGMTSVIDGKYGTN